MDLRRLSVEEHSYRLHLRQHNFQSHLRGRGLCLRGSAEEADFKAPALAIIGSRRPSSYGLAFVESLLERLKRERPETVILSGGALGIDAHVHRTALRLGFRTQAWLVGPIASPHPNSHAELFQEIAQSPGGALLVPESLEPTVNGRAPIKRDWVLRNHWLCAAGDAVVIAEAGLKSGTWSSARFCTPLGIGCHALPGRIDAVQSEGTNTMISAGCAHPITSVEKLVKSLVVELEASSYNEKRYLFPELFEVLGKEAPKPLERGVEDDKVLKILRIALSSPEGFELHSAAALGRRWGLSLTQILQGLKDLAARGELHRSGNRFERRGEL